MIWYDMKLHISLCFWIMTVNWLWRSRSIGRQPRLLNVLLGWRAAAAPQEPSAAGRQGRRRSHCREAVCQSQDSRQRQTVAFKGQQHHTFIKTSFNYDVDELCVSHPVEKHWMLLIENKHEACRDSSPTYSAMFSMKYGSRKAAVPPPPRLFTTEILYLYSYGPFCLVLAIREALWGRGCVVLNTLCHKAQSLQSYWNLYNRVTTHMTALLHFFPFLF